MSDEFFIAKSTVIGTLDEIQREKYDPEKCWVITVNNADKLVNYGQQSVNALVELLELNNPQINALSMLFLGMINELGVNSSQAIEPLKNAVYRNGTKTSEIIGTIALSMIGDAQAIQAKTGFMKKFNINTSEEYNSGAIATVIEYLRTGQNLIN